MLNSYFEIKEGSKIHLVMITKKKYPLYKKMYEILRPHYTEKETQKILGIFMRVCNIKVSFLYITFYCKHS